MFSTFHAGHWFLRWPLDHVFTSEHFTLKHMERLWRETGLVAPRPQGGDKRSDRIEALGPAIFAMVAETVHITLVEIAERLEAEHGERFAPSTVHRFFRRHGWTFKKSRPMPPSRSGPTSPRPARPGSTRSRTWTRTG